MTMFDQKVLDLMIVPKTIAERAKNIDILKKHHQLIHLELSGDEERLFQKTETIPGYLEKYLIVDFDRKRSMICEILFDIHQEYPKVFSLKSYSDITKLIFSTITKYCWSGEEAGIIIRLIAIHIREYLDSIPEDFIITVMQQHDASIFFEREEIRAVIHSNTNMYAISPHMRCTIHYSARESIEEVRYLQKVFRKNFTYFSRLFGAELLRGFLNKDTRNIVTQEKTTHTYLEVFHSILIRKIDTLNLTSEKKIAYKAKILQKPILGSILVLSDILLKRK